MSEILEVRYKYFADIRIKGKIERDKVNNNQLDIMIDKDEATRLVNFLLSCLKQDEQN